MQDSTLDNPLDERSSPALSVTELGLSTRASNVLLGAGINTVSDVLVALEKGDEALVELKGFGPKSLADLKTRLEAGGFWPVRKDLPPLEALGERLGEELRELEELETPDAVAVDTVPEMKGVEAPAITTQTAPDQVARPAEPVQEIAPQAKPTGETLSFGQRLSATLAQPGERFRLGAWIYGVVAVVVIILLLLPPVSLLKRLGIGGYMTLDASSSSISHDDGLTVSVNPDTFTDRLRLKIDSVPRLEFLEGSAGSALRKSVEALPPNLMVKSPVYQVKVRGESAQPVMIDLVMPNDAEPWETLDLYTWTGEEWKWIGSELHTEVAEHEFIRTHVTSMPDTIVAVQADSVDPVVSALVEPDDNPIDVVANVLDEVNPTGLLLGTDGGFVGDPNNLLQPVDGAAYTVIPTLRNWAPGATVNRGLLSDILTIPDIQKSHIANIVQLCAERGFAGVDVDYRGIGPDDRDAYSDFIGALAGAMHAEGLRLSVVVESPVPTNGSWNTGGYDWASLGAAADTIKVPFPEDPAAYIQGGQAERLLDWATAQVSRYKLRMLVSSLSAEQGEANVDHISLEQALAPFGQIVVRNPANVAQIEPGGQVEFGLSSRLLSISPQETSGTYRLEYESDAGESRTIWLGTATNLAVKLQWAQKYHLGGVAVADLLDPGNGPGMVEVVAGYQRAAVELPARQEFSVVWTVASESAVVDQEAAPLTQPDYTWMVLASAGQYTVKATIAGFDHGTVPIVVGESQPQVTEVVTPTEETAEELTAADESPTTTETEAPEGTEVTVDCLEGRYVADVTIPDNTQMEKGEEFVKTWSVKNTGTCDWPENTVLARVDSKLGGPESVEVGAVAVGETVEVSIDLAAPDSDGVYDGKWLLKTGDTEIPKSGLTAVVRVGEAAANVPAVAPVSSGSFELGGHIRDASFPYGDKMHYAGMNWAKVQVHYGADASGLVAAAHGRGFKIQLSALGTPDMVTNAGFEQDFAKWVAQLAAAGADAIEVWNEPNIEREWQIGHISAQAYTNLLCASYSAIKAANAGTAVISAAPSPTGYFGGCSTNGCDDQPWMAGLRDAGAANCMDFIGAHHNSGATSPSARIGHPANPGDPHHSWFFLPQTELYYNTFGGARKLFYTEMGYASQEGVPTFSDWFGWARGTDNSEQAAWLAEAVQLSVNTGMVRCIIVWNIDFVRYGDDPQDGYAIIRPGGGCPACESLHSILGTR
jgi:spore germination protein YaaH